MFTFSARQLLHVRVPLIARELARELRPTGIVVVLGGLVAGAWNAQARTRRLADDGLSVPRAETYSQLERIELHVNDHGDNATAFIDLGVDPVHVWARGTADRPAAPRVRTCRRTTE